MPKSRKRVLRVSPTFEEEVALFKEGYSLVAGLDEVGRGPLAGPVVAGVAIFPPGSNEFSLTGLRDSKLMTDIERERMIPRLQRHALALEVGISTAEEIDDIGIVPATGQAMRRALFSLPLMPQFLLLDAFPLPGIDLPQKPIVHGDTTCLSIAAASVVAKVTRDAIMREQDSVYCGYGFARNKGYGTAEHLVNLGRKGPCDIHRYSFSPIKELGLVRSGPVSS